MEHANLKKILFLSLPMVFAIALAITLAACMAQANRGLNDGIFDPQGTSKTTADNDLPVILPTSRLSFRSNGNGTCSVIGIGSCTDGAVDVPETSPAGDRVTAIGDSAFLGSKTVKQISLPKSVTEIGAYAFYGSSLCSISIHSEIRSIGECAFANCEDLTAITVDNENEKYSSLDGVLFSKDKSELIVYPSGKQNASYTIRSSVKKIHNMAFYACSALKTVNYNGSRAEWEAIVTGSNNDSLTNAELKFPSSKK